jgi:alpha-galactosidase
MNRILSLALFILVFILGAGIIRCQNNSILAKQGFAIKEKPVNNGSWDLLKLWLPEESIPFSFSCDDNHSAELLKKEEDKPRIFTALKGILKVTWEMSEYQQNGCVEWVVKIRNVGTTDSPILSDLMALDLDIPILQNGFNPDVYYSRGCGGGDEGGIEAFMYTKTILKKSVEVQLSNPYGTKTIKWLPFFNLDLGDRGIIGAVGWAGRWMINIKRSQTDTIHLRAGMERLHMVLHPGEEIRTPSILLMAWKGDRIEGHNRFRRHILQHHTPMNDGQIVTDLICFPSWGGMKTENHLKLIETIRHERLPYNCYWIDAGWYGPPHECEEYQNLLTEDWFFNVGDWRVNTMVHPKGLKPISDAAHAAGMKFLLWFDPERAVNSCPMVSQHPDWYFKRIDEIILAGRKTKICIFNFGNPEAQQWMTEFMSNQIKEIGIDVFRHDANFIANKIWDEEDAPDRIGISEIRYVEGVNKFWDELKHRFPNLILDIVQRCDLETISRGLDLTRSDYSFLPNSDPTGGQVSLLSSSYWIPLSSTGGLVRPGDTYNLLSNFSASLMMPFFTIVSDKPVIPSPPDNYPWDWHRNIMALHQKARPFFRGDFYPLLQVSISSDDWSGIQFNRIDLEAGMVLLYRRPHSPYTRGTFRLHGLSADSNYFIDFNGSSSKVKGSELMGTGLIVTAELPQTTNIIFYKRMME